MVELFSIIKEQKSNRLQIRCDNLSFFRCDSPTELIDYLKEHLDYYTVECFSVNTSIKTLDAIDVSASYISSFNIDLFINSYSSFDINKSILKELI